MESGDKRGAGLRWSRAVAHLAIVVVFVLAALGYAPFHERPAEAARREAVRQLPGVRSAIWLDPANLSVLVDGEASRSLAMADRVCTALAPGDAPGVVVHVRDATAKTVDAGPELSRNCGRAPSAQPAR